jgi:hypothetical protein
MAISRPDPLRSDLEEPTRSALDEVILRVHGGVDPKFDRLINDHYDGIAPKAHAELWRRAQERMPDATSIEEVIRAWSRIELLELYRKSLAWAFGEAQRKRQGT